jgi:hypothetical protein
MKEVGEKKRTAKSWRRISDNRDSDLFNSVSYFITNPLNLARSSSIACMTKRHKKKWEKGESGREGRKEGG